MLRQGGLLAVLSFLDFFQTSVQRIAVSTAANMCRGLTADSTDAVNAAVPILTNLLQYEVSSRGPAPPASCCLQPCTFTANCQTDLCTSNSVLRS